MFARILFPTDFSAYANAVFACLPGLRRAGLQQVVLLHVIRPTEVPLPDIINQESLERARWSAEEELHVARMALEGHGLSVATRVEYGSPIAEIVRVAEDERVGLIVMGAQGYTAAQEFLLGTTTFEVVRTAHTPVLTLKFDVVRELGHVKCRQICEDMLARVLYPTDFSECAEAAFRVVKRLKTADTQEVIVVHVQDERAMRHRAAEQLAEFDRIDAERMDALCRTLELFGLHGRAVIRHGIPFRETLKVADELGECLIVLGSRGRSAVRELVAGSTFENVLRLGRHPVLVVRGNEDDER